ncbi:hypothetical protein L1987_63185 [Smallanthus sonchifolius]|uniref:Uncharacterized protein n=1 Tax=Smallanthus sonchifolius TaxID=185202 RepID=A0ACB9CCR7_9ASTR|nr:hypothetical protein L1987_63185 [Smallanthus sonchifolius]
MGRQIEAIITHFSHQHHLHLTNPQPTRICSACKQTLETEPSYTCRSPSCTTFSLHLKCSQLPCSITHPFHHSHPLSLLPKPQNPNGVFTCNACGNHGDGFAYNCKECGVSIHVVCATLPLCLSHRSHVHQLNLVFGSPYGNGNGNGFSCDICGVIEGSGKCWLYGCGLCGFDAHLSCATTSKPQHNLFLNQINQRDQICQAVMMAYGGNNVNNRLLQHIGGGGGGNMNNQILQAILGGGGGCGGGGSNQLLQALMGGGGDGVGGLDLSSVLGNVGDFGGLMGGFGF